MPNRDTRPAKRSRGRRQRPLGVHFLCEINVDAAVRAAISALPGCSASDARVNGFADRTLDQTWVVKAALLRRVLLTQDTDGLDAARYPPGSHAGNLVLHVLPARPGFQIAALQRFLLEHARECRGNIVELRATAAIVTSPKGKRTIPLE